MKRWFPTGWWPFRWWPRAWWPGGDPACYRWYRSNGYEAGRDLQPADVVDWDTIIAETPAGDAAPVLSALALTEDLDYYLGVRAVSSSGVAETGTSRTCRVRISGGVLAGPAPNRCEPSAWRVEAAAGGRLRLVGAYNGRGAAGLATGVQVARVRFGAVSWAAGDLVDTVTLAGRTAAGTYPVSELLSPTFVDGETVALAIRAVTALGTAGAHCVLDPVSADAQAPPAADYVVAEASR